MFGHESVTLANPWNLIDSFARFDGSTINKLPKQATSIKQARGQLSPSSQRTRFRCCALMRLSGLSVVPAMLAVSNLKRPRGICADGALPARSRLGQRRWAVGVAGSVRAKIAGWMQDSSPCLRWPCSPPRFSSAWRTVSRYSCAFASYSCSGLPARGGSRSSR